MKNFYFLKHRFRHATLKNIVGNQRVFRLIFLLAIFVTACRLLGPVRIQWDQNIQLDAAFRLVQGLGLTNAFSSQFEINEPPISELLIHFPPGYSLLVSLFLSLGIPLVFSLKSIYGLTTLIGWFFWAIIASHCLNKPLRFGRIVFPAHLLIAFAFPVFYTPRWEGTDIFLWAGIPVIILLLLRKFENFSTLLLTLIASLSIGFLVSIRYASIFLFPAALLILFYIDYPRFKSILLRCIVFSLPYVLITALPIFYLSVLRADFEASMVTDLLMTHGARYLSGDFLELVGKAVDGFPHLYALTGIGIGETKDYFELFPFLSLIFGLTLLLFMCVLFIEIYKFRRKQETISSNLLLLSNDVPISLSCVLIAFIIFSTALTFVVSYNPLTIHRYYLPVEPCLVLIAYKYASSIESNRIVKYLTSGIIVLFLLFNFFVRPVYAFLDDTKSLTNLVMTEYFTISEHRNLSFPSNKVLYDDTFDNERSIDYLIKNKADNPNSLYLVHAYPRYLNHPGIRDNIEIRRIPDSSFWEKAYTNKPTKIFWVIDTNRCNAICASPGNFNSDDPEDLIPELRLLPNLETVFFDAEEGTRIFMSELPTGFKFVPN